MKLAFASKELREACLSEPAALRAFGNVVGPLVIRRIADLDAAASILDLPVGDPRQVSGYDDRYQIDVGGDHRMIVSANHGRNPKRAGRTDWARVGRIKVEEVSEK